MAYANGAGSLVSLTFDDGLASQREIALPEMNKRSIRGTFFVIASDSTEYDSQFRHNDWLSAMIAGHEIGSHSHTHRKAALLDAAAADFEVRSSKRWLEYALGVQGIKSYCYPYTDAPALLQSAVFNSGYIAARGGRGARPDKYLEPGDGANLFNVPSIHVGPETIGHASEWISTCVRRGAWLTLMFHGVGNPTDWDNITREQFVDLLDKLNAATPLGLAVVPFGEAAALYKKGRN